MSVILPDASNGRPDWQIAIVNGEPEMVLNRAMVEALIADSPLGPVEARRRLVAAGYPFALPEDEAPDR